MAIYVIVAGCLLLPSSLHAQGDPHRRGDQEHGLLPALFSFTRSGQPGGPQYGGMPAAGQPVSYETPGTAIPGTPYYGGDRYGGDGIVTTRIPPQQDWVSPTPLEATIENAFRGSYYRVEYLHWNLQRPGDGLLGAQPLSVRDPRQPFPIFDNQIPSNNIGDATIPTLSEIGLRGNSGIKGTWGIETSFGSVEANYFVLEQADDRMGITGLFPQIETRDATGLVLTITPGRFVGTSLMLNGNRSDIIELYNRTFTASYESDMMGAEVLMRFKDVVNLGFPFGIEMQPLIGFRFIQVKEKFGQVGVFEDITGQAPLLTSRIDSETNNNLFGPMIGMRYELPHPWFTLGFEPKFTLASNSNRALVITQQFRQQEDPTVLTKDRSTYFSAVGDFSAYARIRMTDNIRMTVGYSMMFISKLTRPHDNILYNDNGIFPVPPGVVLRSTSTNLRVQGLSVGIEIDLH